MNPVVIIPTFVTARRLRSAGSVVAVYDHPTPLGKQGELARCLNSLINVQGLGQIVVLVVSEPGIEDQAVEKVRRIVSKFPSLSVAVMGARELDLVQQRFDQLGFGRMSKEVGLTGYASMRNFGLVVADLFGFDAAVFLDDDAVVDDELFLRKAVYGLGKLTRKGIPILAKTGFYLNSEGSFHSKSASGWYDFFWQQGKAFDRWIDAAMRGPRLSRANHVCGGCMVLHREAFRRVAFDPWIARGEDLDYLLNLRMYGSDVWFDNKWHMRHLPPESPNEGERFRQDVYRWLYEGRKLEYSRTQIDLLQVKPASLEPYPGPFLEEGVSRRMRITALLRSIARPDRKAYRRAAKAVNGEAAVYAQRNCMKYFEFQYVWPQLMNGVENDAGLRAALMQSVALPAAAGTSASAREQGVSAPVAGQRGVDPGITSEIRLDISDSE